MKTKRTNKCQSNGKKEGQRIEEKMRSIEKEKMKGIIQRIPDITIKALIVFSCVLFLH